VIESVVDHNGVERKLGLLPETEESRKLRASMPTFSDYLAEAGLPLYSESEWTEGGDIDDFGPEFVLDQQQTSGCVGFSDAAAEMKARAMRGMEFEILSGAFAYSLVNGGYDGGAQILDACRASQSHGYARKSDFDLPHIYWYQVPESVKQDAQTRTSSLRYPINSLEEFFTALMLGYPVQHGVCASGRFNYIDENGVAGYGGNQANHSVHSYARKRIGGVMHAIMGNTWGPWGFRRSGSCYLHPRSLILPGQAFAHVSPKWKSA